MLDYSQYTLSCDSKYVPEVGECWHCPFVDKCDDGSKCLTKKKHRDRTAYYQANKDTYKETARLQRLEAKGNL